MKNYPAPAIWFYLPVILLYDLASVLRSILRQDLSRLIVPSSSVEIRARYDAWKGLGLMLAKRRAVQKRRRVPSWRLLAAMEGLAWPWDVASRYGHLSG